MTPRRLGDIAPDLTPQPAERAPRYARGVQAIKPYSRIPSQPRRSRSA